MFKSKSLLLTFLIICANLQIQAQQSIDQITDEFANELSLQIKINEILRESVIEFCVKYYDETKELKKTYAHNVSEGDAKIEKMWNNFKLESNFMKKLVEIIIQIDPNVDLDDDDLQVIEEHIDQSALIAMKESFLLASIVYNRVHKMK